MSSNKNIEWPVSFRAHVIKQIMQHLSAGESCSVVGVGSVGKSNLLRFLRREDVRQHYLGDDWTTLLFVYIDTNKILKETRWGLLELMLHQLLSELTSRGTDEAVLRKIDELHQRATAPATQFLALRYLDRAIGLACRKLGFRLVFLFDEFDELCRTMSARGFSALRALRDEYKYDLMYVPTTRLALGRLRENASEIEAFEELVSPHTLWLGPYSQADAHLMLNRIGSRYGVLLQADETRQVLRATGGHPGLLREGYNIVREYGVDFFEPLIHSRRVRDECQRLWLSLSLEEQQVIEHLANKTAPEANQDNAVGQLSQKGLLGGPWAGSDEIFSTAFAAFVRQQQGAVRTQVYVDYERREVWVNAHKISKLTRLEFELMAFFDQNRGRACHRDEIAQHLYPEDMGDVDDNRLDSLVKRLRRRLEPEPKNPRYIITIRSHGFQFNDSVPLEI